MTTTDVAAQEPGSGQHFTEPPETPPTRAGNSSPGSGTPRPDKKAVVLDVKERYRKDNGRVDWERAWQEEPKLTELFGPYSKNSMMNAGYHLATATTGRKKPIRHDPNKDRKRPATSLSDLTDRQKYVLRLAKKIMTEDGVIPFQKHFSEHPDEMAAHFDNSDIRAAVVRCYSVVNTLRKNNFLPAKGQSMDHWEENKDRFSGTPETKPTKRKYTKRKLEIASIPTTETRPAPKPTIYIPPQMNFCIQCGTRLVPHVCPNCDAASLPERCPRCELPTAPYIMAAKLTTQQKG